MMTSGDDIDDFVALCGKSNFRNRDEVLDGIRSKKYELIRYRNGSVPARSMLEIYKRRSQHVGQFAANSKHAARIASDIDAYLLELENAMDDEIKLWRVSEDGMWSYALFEGVAAGRILGCIYGVDRRTVSSEEWDRLWGRVAE